MITLKEAREQGGLDQFAKDHEGVAPLHVVGVGVKRIGKDRSTRVPFFFWIASWRSCA